MRNYLFIFVITLIAFYSCKRDEVPSNNNITTHDITLKRFVIVDPSFTTPNDTIGTITYTYDNLDRCIQINSLDYPYTGVTNTYNFYNNNDTLISKRKIVYNDTADSTWEHFTYDSNGRMLSDSLVHLPGANSTVFNYQRTGNTIISMIAFNTDPTFKGIYSITRDGVGNIISEKDSIFEYIPGPGYVFDVTSLVTISYDNHPCPFYKLYPKRLVVTDYVNADKDDQPFYSALVQQNNILQEKRTGPSNGLESFNNTFNYQYNTNNYPANVIFHNNQSGTTLKGFYFY